MLHAISTFLIQTTAPFRTFNFENLLVNNNGNKKNAVRRFKLLCILYCHDSWTDDNILIFSLYSWQYAAVSLLVAMTTETADCRLWCNEALNIRCVVGGGAVYRWQWMTKRPLCVAHIAVWIGSRYTTDTSCLPALPPHRRCSWLSYVPAKYSVMFCVHQSHYLFDILYV